MKMLFIIFIFVIYINGIYYKILDYDYDSNNWFFIDSGTYNCPGNDEVSPFYLEQECLYDGFDYFIIYESENKIKYYFDENCLEEMKTFSLLPYEERPTGNTTNIPEDIQISIGDINFITFKKTNWFTCDKTEVTSNNPPRLNFLSDNSCFMKRKIIFTHYGYSFHKYSTEDCTGLEYVVAFSNINGIIKFHHPNDEIFSYNIFLKPIKLPEFYYGYVSLPNSQIVYDLLYSSDFISDTYSNLDKMRHEEFDNENGFWIDEIENDLNKNYVKSDFLKLIEIKELDYIISGEKQIHSYTININSEFITLPYKRTKCYFTNGKHENSFFLSFDKSFGNFQFEDENKNETDFFENKEKMYFNYQYQIFPNLDEEDFYMIDMEPKEEYGKYKTYAYTIPYHSLMRSYPTYMKTSLGYIMYYPNRCVNDEKGNSFKYVGTKGMSYPSKFLSKLYYYDRNCLEGNEESIQFVGYINDFEIDTIDFHILYHREYYSCNRYSNEEVVVIEGYMTNVCIDNKLYKKEGNEIKEYNCQNKLMKTYRCNSCYEFNNNDLKYGFIQC